MPRNGSGSYNLPSDVNPVVPGTLIESNWANSTLDDVATALTASISVDGQTLPTENLPMGGYKHTGVGDPTATDQYGTLGMRQRGTDIRVVVTGGANTIVGTLVGLTAYTQYMVVSFVPLYNNVAGAVTFSINGLTAYPLYDGAGEDLSPDDLVAGSLVTAYFTGSAWKMLSVPATSASGQSSQKTITGWLEPDGGYTALTVASPTEVGIPAGTGVIVYANGSVETVSWDAQNVDISATMTTETRSWVFIDDTGSPIVITRQPESSVYRENICLGYAIHVDGATITEVVTAPAILGSNNYAARDTTNIWAGSIVSGGASSSSGSTAQRYVYVEPAKVLIPGAGYTDDTAVNLVDMAGGSPITFDVVSGHGEEINLITAGTTTAPTGVYYRIASSDTAALTGTQANIHRLFWLGGSSYVWMIGQGRVENENGSSSSTLPYDSMDDALLYLAYNRANFIPISALNGATLVAEIVATFESTTVSWINHLYNAILPVGKYNASIGASGGIGEAPIDGNTYGRKDGAWDQVTAASTPAFTGDLTVTKADPQANLVMSPLVAGDFAQLGIKQGANNWLNLYGDYDSNELRVRIHDPSDGSLLDQIVIDATTYETDFPAAVSVNGVDRGDVFGSDSAVTSGGMALYDGTTGKLLQDGPVPGDVVTYDVQTSTTDNDPTHVMLATGYGLGTTDALYLPSGTTAERPGSPVDSMVRHNSTLGAIEAYLGGWVTLGTSAALILPDNYLGGLSISNSVVNPTNALNIAAGSCTNDGEYGVPSSQNTSSAQLATAMGKVINSAWAVGGTTAVPLGGFPAALGSPVNNNFYCVFLIWKDDGTVDVGFDAANATDASNLLATGSVPELAGFKHYRRIGWVYYVSSTIKKFWQDGNLFMWDATASNYSNAVNSALTDLKGVTIPPSTQGQFSVVVGPSAAGTYTSYIKLRDAQATSAAAGSTDFDLVTGRGGTSYAYNGSGRLSAKTNSSSQIKVSVSTVGAYSTYSLQSLGWVDTRGQ